VSSCACSEAGHSRSAKPHCSNMSALLRSASLRRGCYLTSLELRCCQHHWNWNGPGHTTDARVQGLAQLANAVPASSLFSSDSAAGGSGASSAPPASLPSSGSDGVASTRRCVCVCVVSWLAVLIRMPSPPPPLRRDTCRNAAFPPSFVCCKLRA